MPRAIFVVCLSCFTAWVAFDRPDRAAAEAGGTARPILLDANLLAVSKHLWLAGDPVIARDIQSLIREADAKLTAGPYSVVFSPEVAPSGDPHDFVSYAAYWWPNPDTPDGIPWISRDGYVNPDNAIDGGGMCDLQRATYPLSLAYYFTGEEKYAEKLADLIRVWFLNEETYMNPRNEYAQLKPRHNGTWYAGIFDVAGFGNCMPAIFDGAGILESSPAWTADDKARLQAWTRQLVTWALSSFQGALQFREPSNHGTNFDFLMALFSLYHDDLITARESIGYYLYQRMPGQMALDGSNPLEMKRANNLLYHRYNLGRALDLASLARTIDNLDPFDYEMEDGRSLRLALEFLLPYMLKERNWDKWPGNSFPPEPLAYYTLLRQAAIYFQEPLLLDAADSLGYVSVRYVNLTHPREAVVERLVGDFDTDGALTVQDIDLMTRRMNATQFFRRYDLDKDGRVSLADRIMWVEDIIGTHVGDANLNRAFGTEDLVLVMQAGEYRDSELANSTWSTGDWNGDFEFDEADLVLAFQRGGYQPSTSRAPVPEPAVWVMGIMGLAWFQRAWRRPGLHPRRVARCSAYWLRHSTGPQTVSAPEGRYGAIPSGQ